MDPLSGSSWSAREMVEGFARSAPNATLMHFATGELGARGSLRAIDIGCGAGRNAVPLAALGAEVLGTDLSLPMVIAARDRARAEDRRIALALAPMDALPAPTGAFDLVIAHGIWNLARSAAEFRRAVAEGARVARRGAALFAFTFSRHTLPPEAERVRGEPFVFTQFMGEPQCFLTEGQLIEELGAAGFEPDPGLPLRELNVPKPGALAAAARVPVIYEGGFRRK